MVALASQIVFFIFAAAVIGSVAGYLVRGIRHAARIADIERVWQTRLTQREQELEALRSGVGQPSVAAEAALLQTKVQADPMLSETGAGVISPTPADAGQFDSKFSKVLSLIEALAKSQERVESELKALKGSIGDDFTLEPSQPKS